MDAGKMLVGAGIGAAKGYFDSNVKQAQNKNESDRLAKENQRKIDLLAKREAVQASYSYKLQELKGQQDLTLEAERGKNNLATAQAKQTEKASGLSSKEIMKLKVDTTKEYQAYVADTKANMGEAVPESEWTRERFKNYPDILEALGQDKEPPKETVDTSSFVSSVLNRVKGRGGSESNPSMPVNDGSTGTGDVVVKTKWAGSGDGKAAVEPMPLGDDKSKKEQSIVKEAEREISKGNKSKELRKAVGNHAKAVNSSDKKEASTWALKIEKLLAEIRSMGKSFRGDDPDEKSIVDR